MFEMHSRETTFFSRSAKSSDMIMMVVVAMPEKGELILGIFKPGA